MKRKIVAAIPVWFLLLAFFSPFAHAAQTPDIYGKYGVAVRAKTNDIVYEKNAHDKAYPASITKIMTALLLMEHMDKTESMVASKKAVSQEASNWDFTLHLGERINRQDALEALMILSANDVAYAIAEHISGSAEGFGKLMTKRAKELGAANTHFVSPNGLHHPNHFTTAYDMTLILKEALKYPEIQKVMAARTAVVKTDERTVTITSKNKIPSIPSVIGGKTGFTNAAGNTLAVATEKNGELILSVTMQSGRTERYEDIISMSEYAFSQIQNLTFVKKNQVFFQGTLYDTPYKGIAAKTYQTVYIEHKKNDIKTVVQLDSDKKSFEKGETIGTILVQKKGKTIQKIPLVSDADVKKPLSFTFVLFLLLAAFVAGFLYYRRYLQSMEEVTKEVYDLNNQK